MRLNIIKKSPAEIEAMKGAGRLSAYVLRKVGEAAKPGVSTLELDELLKHSFVPKAESRPSRAMAAFLVPFAPR